MTRRWLPTNTASKLVLADTILADVVPTITAARQRILNLVPGHSGKPAGTGDPPGGTSSTVSVVERIAAKRSTEREDLDTLDQCVNTIDTLTRQCIIHAGGRLPQPLHNASHARRLAWDRWAIRTITPLNPHIPNNVTRELCDTAAHLESIINSWAPPSVRTQRATELAADDTETWCRSHLRCGHRVPRDPRYRTQGICRWCGDFHAQQGFMPTLDLLDDYESGKRITLAMIDKARPSRGPKPRRKK